MLWNCLSLFAGLNLPQLLQRVRRNPSRRAAAAPAVRIEGLEQRLVLTPTSDEQLFVYLLNKIRHDPQAYDDAENLGGILDSVVPRQPLAVNADLFDSARFHAVEMANNNYFDHQSEVTGDWPNKMARDQGYDLPDHFPNNANYIESIAAGNLFGDPADVIKLLIIDEGVPSLGHRNHLLGINSFNEQAREIGVGHGFNLSSLYDHYWAAHITFPDIDGVFLTGVVYQDGNLDQSFGLNEGLGGVTVSLAGQGLSTQTNGSGGWAIRVPSSGTYTVQVSGGTFTGSASSAVQVTTLNREVDFISGNSTGVVDFTPAPMGSNDPPENALPAGPLLAQEDVPFSITGISITDPDAGTGNVSVTLSVTQGVLQVATGVPSGVTAQQISGNNSNQVVLTATLAQINATLANSQGLIYRSATNFNGADQLSLLTNDLGNSGTGGSLTDFDPVEISVAAVNDVPINSVPTAAYSVVTETSVSLTGISFNDVDLGVQNAEVELSVLQGTITLRTDVASGLTPAHITNNGTDQVVIVAPRALILATFAATGGISYTSLDGFIGADTFTISTSDLGSTGSGPVGVDVDTVAIQVQAVPLPPTISLPSNPVASSKRKPVIVGSGASLSDPDSPSFNTGRITVEITIGQQSTDKLTLNKVGARPGQLNLRKTDIRLGKNIIGRVSGGTNGDPFVIRFTTNVDLSTVQTVMRNITLRASRGRLLPGTRTVSIVAIDPTSLSSLPATRQAEVV